MENLRWLRNSSLRRFAELEPYEDSMTEKEAARLRTIYRMWMTERLAQAVTIGKGDYQPEAVVLMIEELKTRIDDASHYVPLEQLCLSPQCGFSSTDHGNQITPDDQAAKMRHVVQTARAVWG